jgi:hypothetical protein
MVPCWVLGRPPTDGLGPLAESPFRWRCRHRIGDHIPADDRLPQLFDVDPTKSNGHVGVLHQDPVRCHMPIKSPRAHTNSHAIGTSFLLSCISSPPPNSSVIDRHPSKLSQPWRGRAFSFRTTSYPQQLRFSKASPRDL